MAANLRTTFAQLRDVLKASAGGFRVTHDDADHYGVEAPVGPATLKAWGGKARASTIPVAWVQTAKSHVGYHLMGIQGNAKLLESLSADLRARMHGKTCFNFESLDDAMKRELERVTAESLRAMKKVGYIADTPAE
jgi:hypothetical protein